MKSTQVFREEYIAKQSKARGELLHHMTLLQVEISKDIILAPLDHPGSLDFYVLD